MKKIILKTLLITATFIIFGCNSYGAPEPFVGVTTNGTAEKGLYKIKETGISTDPVIDAAKKYLNSLNEEQRKKTLFPVDDPEWRTWINWHRGEHERLGVSLEEMNKEQRQVAYNLLETSLSAKGYKTSRDIMKLNHHLGELTSKFDEYGEHRYWFTVMGTPSKDKPWGWQLEGHHLIVNYFVLGDQIVMTPTFMGSEPVIAKSGKYKGTSILQTEQNVGFAFMKSLSFEQQQKAIISKSKGRSENLGELHSDNAIVSDKGLAVSELNNAQRNKLLEVIGLYIGNIKKGHAQVKMDEILAYWKETYFAWKGDVEEGGVFYYRIYSPVVMIEFDHQGPIALGQRWEGPTRLHAHTVVRTPNGNDYGKDLLRQHYETSDHHNKADKKKQ